MEHIETAAYIFAGIAIFYVIGLIILPYTGFSFPAWLSIIGQASLGLATPFLFTVLMVRGIWQNRYANKVLKLILSTTLSAVCVFIMIWALAVILWNFV